MQQSAFVFKFDIMAGYVSVMDLNHVCTDILATRLNDDKVILRGRYH